MKLKLFLMLMLAGTLVVACDKGEKKDEEKKEDDKEQNDDTASEDDDSGAESSSGNWSSAEVTMLKSICKSQVAPVLEKSFKGQENITKNFNFDSFCDCFVEETQKEFDSFQEFGEKGKESNAGAKIGQKCAMSLLK